MKKLFTLLLLFGSVYLSAQCTTTNATGCDCPDGSDTCDLIPNIKVSYDLLVDPTENPETPGMLRVSVSTPSVGWGPLTVEGTNFFVCGADTINSPGGLQQCPDGSTPKQLVRQRIYRKEGNTMTSWVRWAGSMTYHPNHGHSHFDEWGVYTLRVQTADPNPLNWPIIGSGAKLGFCLMDYGTCGFYNGHCRDDNDNIITNGLPNNGLGGGNYNCSPTQQGISVGYTDIYYQYLDGMYITIPPGTCNGDYAVVVEVDPNHFLMETRYDDNVMWAPITLTRQTNGATDLDIAASGPTNTCDANGLTLSVTPIGSSYLWSNGETTPTIPANASGSYTCQVTTPCGVIQTDTMVVNIAPPAAPVAGDTLMCMGQSAVLEATAAGTVNWYDAPQGGNLLFSGNTFTTPALNATTSYWVENFETRIGATGYVGPDTVYTTGNPQVTGFEIFTVYAACTLNSVLVFANNAGNRTIELRDNAGTVLQSATVNIPAGESRVTLNFPLTPGTDYELGCTANPNLKRSNSNVSYPYSLPGVLDITDSGYGQDYFYYFFDWEVKMPDETCVSPREEIVVAVDPCMGANDLPANMEYFQIQPNPTDGEFFLEFSTTERAQTEWILFDATGKRVMGQQLGTVQGNFRKALDVKHLPAGLYNIQVITGQHTTTRRLVKN
jgi:hypothetical protein